jgi:hypothetical protein
MVSTPDAVHLTPPNERTTLPCPVQPPLPGFEILVPTASAELFEARPCTSREDDGAN